jgi:hypothetical protein
MCMKYNTKVYVNTDFLFLVFILNLKFQQRCYLKVRSCV